MIKQELKSYGTSLKLFLFLIGSIVLLVGLYYLIHPAKVITTDQGTEVFYNYETGTTLVVPGLVMVAIVIVRAMADMKIKGLAVFVKKYCPHCNMEVEVVILPEYRKATYVEYICPQCGKRI